MDSYLKKHHHGWVSSVTQKFKVWFYILKSNNKFLYLQIIYLSHPYIYFTVIRFSTMHWHATHWANNRTISPHPQPRFTATACLLQGHGPLTRYVKLRVLHAPGMPGTFSPPPRVSAPDMHHGTCATHAPWCVPGSLTSGCLWSRWRENVAGIPGACATRKFTYLVRGTWKSCRRKLLLPKK